MLKMLLNCLDWSHQASIVTETKYDNYVTDHMDAIFIENEIVMSWSIRPGVVCDENQAKQRHDRL